MRHKNYILLFICVILRLCCLISRESYYVADEYWQSLEVAHKLIFGYGYLTWEWVYAIRSYVYVGWIAVLYKALKIFQKDNVQNLVLLPCIIQGIFTGISDTYFIAWVHKISRSSSQVYWSVWFYMTNVFLAYCATRTLTNIVETNLTCIALYYYPWFKSEKNNVKYLWFVFIACVIRPTAIIQWSPLCYFAIMENKHPLKLIYSKYIPIGLFVLTVSTLIDSYLYGKWVFTWWNFLVFNVFYNISANYSVQSVYWYFVLGLPIVLGPCIAPFYTSLGSKIKTQITDTTFNKLFNTIIFSLILYSFIPHKEFRFILPLCPLMIFMSSYSMHKWTASFKKIQKYLLAFVILIISLLVLYYLCHFHQVATIKVMQYLNNPQNNLLFLMPCHMVPMYSHLHINIPTRFLHCNPNLTNDKNYVEEATSFYKNPAEWLEKEYSTNDTSIALPTHIICFNTLVPLIKHFLISRNYENWLQLYHGNFVPPKVGNYLLVFNRTTHQNKINIIKSLR